MNPVWQRSTLCPSAAAVMCRPRAAKGLKKLCVGITLSFWVVLVDVLLHCCSLEPWVLPTLHL